MRRIVAIDPGANGAFAFYSDGIITLETMPDTEGDIADLIRSRSFSLDHVYLEQVTGFIGKAQPGSRMFTFGENYGFLKGCFQALQIPVTLVRPQEWQAGIVAAGLKEKAERKRRIKEFVQREYPSVERIIGDTADALGILHWAITKKENKL